MVEIVSRGSHEAYIISDTSHGIGYCIEINNRLLEHPTQLMCALDYQLKELLCDYGNKLIDAVTSSKRDVDVTAHD